MRRIKCVVVGDFTAEKTQLLFSYATGKPPPSDPFVCENYSVFVTVRGEVVQLDLWDTAGQDDYKRLRPLCYPQTHVFLVCLSVVSPSSYEDVRDNTLKNAGLKWVPEISHFCPGTPFLLVGTRTELREDQGVLRELAKSKQRPLTPEDGERLATETKAVKYMECSAQTMEGVKEVFDEAAAVAVEKDETKKNETKKNCILQ